MKAISVPLAFLAASLVSCQVKTYAPPPQKAVVDTVEVEVRSLEGRPEAIAIVQGQLTTTAAQLVDPVQHREEGRLYVDVLEQTPRGASLMTDLSGAPEFETRVPLEILGLDPGPHVVSVNGIEATFEIPRIQAESYGGDTLAAAVPPVELVDEFIAIEDSSFIDPALANAPAAGN